MCFSWLLLKHLKSEQLSRIDVSEPNAGEQGGSSFSPFKDHAIILNCLSFVFVVPFDLKKTVGGEFIVFILSLVYSHIASISILFDTVLVIAQISCCLSVFQSNDVA